MFIKEGLLLIIGGFTGWVVFILPHILWLDDGEKLDKEAFKTKFPEKAKICTAYRSIPYIWIVLYILFIFPNLPKLNNGEGLSFFSAYFLVAGLGILDGLVEVITNFAPIRISGKVKGALVLKFLVSNESVQRTGFFRIGLTLIIGVIAWLIL